MDRLSDRVAARTRVAGTHRPPVREEPPEAGSDAQDDDASTQLATVIPFGIFDADAEADRW